MSRTTRIGYRQPPQSRFTLNPRHLRLSLTYYFPKDPAAREEEREGVPKVRERLLNRQERG